MKKEEYTCKCQGTVRYGERTEEYKNRFVIDKTKNHRTTHCRPLTLIGAHKDSVKANGGWDDV